MLFNVTIQINAEVSKEDFNETEEDIKKDIKQFLVLSTLSYLEINGRTLNNFNVISIDKR